MSKIQWTEKTWNPVAGCSVVSPGCTNCYAMRMAARLEAMGQAKYAGLTKKVNGLPVWTGKINLDEKALTIPLRTRKPTVWFVNSMSDLFHEGVPFEFVDKVFAVMALTPHHTYQILTKRPERMAEYLQELDGKVWPENGFAPERVQMICVRDYGRNGVTSDEHRWRWPLPNVWAGTSCERQKEADERIPHLLRCPAAVRFISAEPLLEPIRFDDPVGVDRPSYFYGYDNFDGPRDIHWVIVGGESGPGARPMDVAWARSIVGQCKAAGVACFVKQLGAKPYHTDNVLTSHEAFGIKGAHSLAYLMGDSKGGDPAGWPQDLRVRQFPSAVLTTAKARQ